METYLKLPRFHQRFIDEWLVLGNRTWAMRKLRPKIKQPKEYAYQLCLRPEIMQAYAERSAFFEEETRQYISSVKRKCANAANANRREAVGPDGKLLPFAQWPEGLEDAVDGFKLDPDTQKITEIKLAPLIESRRLYLESQKQLVRRNSLEDPNGNPLPPGVARLMIVTQEEAKKLDAELDAAV